MIVSLVFHVRSQMAEAVCLRFAFARSVLQCFFIFLLALRARFFMPRFCKARYWWETFVVTKVLPPSPLSKELWILVRS